MPARQLPNVPECMAQVCALIVFVAQGLYKLGTIVSCFFQVCQGANVWGIAIEVDGKLASCLRAWGFTGWAGPWIRGFRVLRCHWHFALNAGIQDLGSGAGGGGVGKVEDIQPSRTTKGLSPQFQNFLHGDCLEADEHVSSVFNS